MADSNLSMLGAKVIVSLLQRDLLSSISEDILEINKTPHKRGVSGTLDCYNFGRNVSSSAGMNLFVKKIFDR